MHALLRDCSHLAPSWNSPMSTSVASNTSTCVTSGFSTTDEGNVIFCRLSIQSLRYLQMSTESKYLQCQLMSIMNIYSAESWSISTALCVLSGNVKISLFSTIIVWNGCYWALGYGDRPVVSSRPSDLHYLHCNTAFSAPSNIYCWSVTGGNRGTSGDSMFHFLMTFRCYYILAAAKTALISDHDIGEIRFSEVIKICSSSRRLTQLTWCKRVQTVKLDKALSTDTLASDSNGSIIIIILKSRSTWQFCKVHTQNSTYEVLSGTST